MRRVVLCVALLALSGCATFSEDGGFGAVESAVRERSGQQPQWVRSESDADTVRARVQELLGAPLSADSAAQIALLNNPGLQADFAEIGIAEADLVRASRWSGPKLSFARLRRGNETEFERSVFLDVLGLVTIPLSTRAEGKRLEAAKTRAASRALAAAHEARQAWVAAVTAEQSVRYLGQVRDAADAGAELARRMAAVGNWSKLSQAREQVFYADATAQLARARQARVAARERLVRALGLWGEDAAFALPERLPDLPQQPREVGAVEAQAIAQRLDVQAARRDAESLAESLGLARSTRFLDLVELGYHHSDETGSAHQRGWEIELRIPLFEFGGARTVRAEHQYAQAVNRAREAAVRARSEVREAYHAYRTAFDLARHYRDEIVPLRRAISEEVLLRYNGMLASVFELLAESRESIAAVSSYILALQDFWIAESALQVAMTSHAPGMSGAVAAPAMAGARTAAPAH